MTDMEIGRVRIRGDASRRLARVAAGPLAQALDHALGAAPDATLGTLTVTLDVDPADYDDETLAILWAERIRAATLGALALPDDPEAQEPAGEPTHRGSPHAPEKTTVDNAAAPSGGPAASADAVAAQVRAWLAAGAPASALPRALAAADSAPMAAEVVSRLSVGKARAWLAAMDRATRRAESSPPPSGPSVSTSTPAAWGDHAPPERAQDAVQRASASPDREALATPEPDRVADAAAHVRRLAELAPGAAMVDALTASAWGGLVLLYPWLGDLCDAASDARPDQDPVVARRRTLSVLAAGDHRAVDDPLVRVLAGSTDEPGGEAEVRDEDIEAAERVLAAFAALLPGFDESSATFIRDGWITRPALIDAGPPVRVTAESAPLDVVLSRLPYPLAGFRLPWTDVVEIRFVP
ncbi:contractile injection system tape measure protein [uncultured Demequina sp.]|uniref:contractile injection system tape measure protein n=1 Tax=uncultured Demequina sp. TaxID=693499 RepID=UPI0025D3C943|nr:contractile injection system tape measure protein [uncultured Demequina sp.]